VGLHGRVEDHGLEGLDNDNSAIENSIVTKNKVLTCNLHINEVGRIVTGSLPFIDIGRMRLSVKLRATRWNRTSVVLHC